MASLMYGAGLRVTECLRLRIKDLDFDFRQIVVHDGKGGKDRVTPLPESLTGPLRGPCGSKSARLHGSGTLTSSMALARKYPNAPYEIGWWYLFPASNRARDPQSGKMKRHHLDASAIQKAIKEAIRRAGIHKHASAHTFRHSFATHILAAGYDIRTVQELLGHRDVKTTMIYTHVLQRGGAAVRSPMDTLGNKVRYPT